MELGDFLAISSADSQTGHLIRDNSSRRRSADTEDRRNRGGISGRTGRCNIVRVFDRERETRAYGSLG